jgi:hypothetical protein
MSNVETPASRQPHTSGRANAIELAIVLGSVLVVHLLPRLLLGQDSFVTIFDNLDSDLVYRVLTAKPGRLLDGHAVVSEMVGGLPRWTYPSGLKLGSILFWLFPPFTAYVVLETVVATTGALGMWLLLRDHLPSRPVTRILIAIAFGLLPYFSIFELSVSGQALVAWALFNLWFDQRRKVSLLVCALYPFASILQSPGAFVVALSGFLLLVAVVAERKTVTKRQFMWPALGVVLLGLGYLIADFDFLRGLLFGNFVSHRAVWTETPKDGFSIDPTVQLWLSGRPYHAESRHSFIFAVAVLTMIVLALRRQWRAALQILGMIVLASVLALTLNIFKSPALVPVIKLMPALVQVTLRFWWSLPVIWFFTLGLVAYHWPRTRFHGRWLVGLLVLELCWVLHNPWSGVSELEQNHRALLDRAMGKPLTLFSYRKFLSEDAFSRIRQHVGPGDTGRFLAIGFHPSVLALNGFDCADGYRDFYSLEYKQRFRRLIAGELRADPTNKGYFDNYGSRVYVFLRGKRRAWYSAHPERLSGVLTELSLNEAALHDLGVGWVASTYLLRSRAALPFLHYEGTFADASGGFTIYLYRVREAVTRLATHG